MEGYLCLELINVIHSFNYHPFKILLISGTIFIQQCFIVTLFPVPERQLKSSLKSI